MLGQLLCQWHGALVHADRWIADFSTGGIKPRVARLLEYLAEIEEEPNSDNGTGMPTFVIRDPDGYHVAINQAWAGGPA